MKIGAFVMGVIALLVAGIGIMNIMLVSVTERTTRDRHTQVARRQARNILMQFLLEAVVLCNVGGVIGVVLGFALGNAGHGFFAQLRGERPARLGGDRPVFCSAGRRRLRHAAGGEGLPAEPHRRAALRIVRRLGSRFL